MSTGSSYIQHEHTVELLPDSKYRFTNIKGCASVTLNKQGFETYSKLREND